MQLPSTFPLKNSTSNVLAAAVAAWLRPPIVMAIGKLQLFVFSSKAKHDFSVF